MTEIKEKKPRKKKAVTVAEAVVMAEPMQTEVAVTLPVTEVFKTKEDLMLEAVSAEIQKEKDNRKN